jgi:hypothetical protein
MIMIIDCDSHFSPFRKLPESINAEEWNDFMAEANVDKGICWMMQQHLDDPGESNKYIYESSKKFSRIIPFGWIMLTTGLQASIDETKRCLDEYGFCGVKLNGSQNKHNIDSDEALKIIELVAKAGKVMAFHIGAEAPVYCDPTRGTRIAKLFPELRIIMVHMGGVIEPDMSEKVIEAAKESPNMMLVGSAIPMPRVANGIRKLGANRIAYGSDQPYHGPSKEKLDEYREMLKEFDAETSEMVLGGNAKKFLKVD